MVDHARHAAGGVGGADRGLPVGQRLHRAAEGDHAALHVHRDALGFALREDTDLGGGKSIQFSIQGPDLAELARLSRGITAQLQQVIDRYVSPTVGQPVKLELVGEIPLDVNVRNAVLKRHRVLNLMTHVDPWRKPDRDHTVHPR